MHLPEIQELNKYLIADWHKPVYHFEIGTMTWINESDIKKNRWILEGVLYLCKLDCCWFQYNMYVLVQSCFDFHVLKDTNP